MKRFLTLGAALLIAAAAHGQGRLAVVDVSAAYLRAKPDYESPLETQALMGGVMEVLDSSSYWVKVNLLDPPYTAWVNRLQIAILNDFEKYAMAPKLVCSSRYATLFAGPSDKTHVICDLVRGDILLDLGRAKRGFVEVSTPGGRKGWVRGRDLCSPNKLDGSAESVVEEALSYLGTPYLWGGSCVKGFDCSGLVRQVYFMAGVLLPRNASEQLLCGDRVDVSKVLSGNLENLEKGDLLFFGNPETGRVSHVAIYVGDGHIVHSSMVVRDNSLIKGSEDYYENSWRLLYGRRIFCPDMESKGIALLKNSPLY